MQARVKVCILDWLLKEDTALIDGFICVGNTDISDSNAVTYLF
jgi:hypothetical protein